MTTIICGEEYSSTCVGWIKKQFLKETPHPLMSLRGLLSSSHFLMWVETNQQRIQFMQKVFNKKKELHQKQLQKKVLKEIEDKLK